MFNQKEKQMYPSNTPMVGKQVAEQPVLVGAFKSIQARINTCHEAATRIENVVDRLLNPAPRPAGGEAPVPAPQTIEAMLNCADSNVDGLSSRLHELAARLERAA